MRSLYYDEESSSFILSNCTNIDLDLATATATTTAAATTSEYVTNYLMAAAGIISALSIWFVSPGTRNDVWMTAFFAFFGIGNMIVSVGSHTLSRMNMSINMDMKSDMNMDTDMDMSEDQVNSYRNIMLIVVVAHHFIVVSYSALLYTGIKSFSFKRFTGSSSSSSSSSSSNESIYLLIIKAIWLVASVTILIIVGFRIFNAMVIWGLIVGVSMTSIYIYQGIHVSAQVFVKALGIIIYISAYLVRLILEDSCGIK